MPKQSITLSNDSLLACYLKNIWIQNGILIFFYEDQERVDFPTTDNNDIFLP